jgi:hypothetical protein
MPSVDERFTHVERGVNEIGPGVYAITAEPPRGRVGRFLHRIRRVLLGRPLPSTRERRERLTWITALAILGGDLIASSVPLEQPPHAEEHRNADGTLMKKSSRQVQCSRI